MASLNKVSFYSNKLQKQIDAEVLEERKRTVKLMLDNGKIIIKKIGRIIYER